MLYIEICKGMPGLKQAGRIANNRLQRHLATFGYALVPCTPSLWKHESRPVTLSLVVDDFGVKYVGKEHADHLINALQQLYQISIDWNGTLYLGLTFSGDLHARLRSLGSEQVSAHITYSTPGCAPCLEHSHLRRESPICRRTRRQPASQC